MSLWAHCLREPGSSLGVLRSLPRSPAWPLVCPRMCDGPTRLQLPSRTQQISLSVVGLSDYFKFLKLFLCFYDVFHQSELSGAVEDAATCPVGLWLTCASLLSSVVYTGGNTGSTVSPRRDSSRLLSFIFSPFGGRKPSVGCSGFLIIRLQV